MSYRFTTPMSQAPQHPRISVVIPAFNEEAGIAEAVSTVESVLRLHCGSFEILVVDDGSVDATFDQVAVLANAGHPVRCIRFSRNFGKEAALLAGLKAAQGDAVITMDADLQHPPCLIPQLIDAWTKGAMVVHAIKRDRGGDPWWIRARASAINNLLAWLGGIDVRQSSDYKLLDRRVVHVLTRDLHERQRFYRGLSEWIGFSQATIPFDVAQRESGASGWSFKQLVALAITAIISFTSAPLRIVSMLGAVTFALAIIIGSQAVWSWVQGRAVSGFATTIITLLFIGSFIMISLGIIGEYIAKIYDELKARPPYVIEKLSGGASPANNNESCDADQTER